MGTENGLLTRLRARFRRLSARRVKAVLIKEFIQLRRDRVTFGMIVGVPLVELVLFGFAINSDPKHLPTAVFVQDHSAYTRAIVNAFGNSGYFRIVAANASEAEGDLQLARGDVAFVVTIPEGFTRRLLRNEHPQVLLEADATDPASASNALAAAIGLARSALAHQRLAAAGVTPGDAPFEVVPHRSYNPEGISQYNTVPGLLGVILTMTMVMMPALALTREVERGTMENLLAMPVTPLEVMLGKVLPYAGMGAVQVLIILAVAHGVFEVPMLGSYPLLFAMLALFIACVSTLGYLISTVARSQMQAMQLTFFFFLPSMLLSGFMFPFRGMPEWAQHIGSIFPLTHFLRIVRGIMLKGTGLTEVAPHVWPLLLFLLVVATVALTRFRRTLDA
jgi:ABC-2 type transport system permease protein